MTSLRRLAIRFKTIFGRAVAVVAGLRSFVVIQSRLIGAEHHKLPCQSLRVEPTIPVKLQCLRSQLIPRLRDAT